MGPGLEAERFRSLHRFGSLPEAILAARRTHGSARVAFEDIEGNSLTYGQLALAGAVLERALRARFAPGERVGLLLPAAPGAIAVLLAFWRAGRVPAMLNPTVGVGPVLSALRTAGCTTVISSRAFVEKGGLGDLVEAVRAAGFDLLWTEDLRAAVTRFDKLAALVAARFTPRDLRRETEAAVLFTSGTEGAPKGVVLTHGNLLANVAQLQARAPIGPTDRAVSALPLFHSFGLTAGIVLMLATGIRTGLHPSPLHYRVIPELVKKLQATILIGTDTFLTGWGRRATAEHFASLRAVVAGGEPVKADDPRGLVRTLRGDDPRRLRRDRDRPGAGAERPRGSADRHGRPAASRDRASAGAGGRGGWPPAAGAGAKRHGRLPAARGRRDGSSRRKTAGTTPATSCGWARKAMW